jgi:glucokinase
MLTACCDIGGTNTQAALADAQGNLITSAKIPTDSTSVETVVRGAAGLLTELLETPDAENAGVRAVGVAAAGTVRFADGTVVYSPNLPFRNTPLKEMLAEILRLPVMVDNDANLAALGENRFGAGRGTKDMVMLTIGTGIGGGILIGGHLYRGRDGGAGEFGHMVIDRNGPVCACGNRGCLEAIAGGRAIAAGSGPKEIIERQAGEAIGIALANIINTLNPEMIVLGGGVVEDRQDIVTIAAKAAVTKALSPNRDNVKIISAALGNQAGLAGAGVMIAEAQ